MTKIALVTSAGSGIGRATAQLLADRGFGVITTYHRHPADHVSLALDVADTSSFPAFADSVRSVLREHWQRDTFDYLVNNAGIGGPSPFETTTDEAYERYHRTLLKGPFFLTQALLPLLSDRGAIVNVGSSSTRPGVTTPGYAAYAAMKGAIEVFTRYLAKELGPRGITANVVAPGAIATDFAGGIVRDTPALRDRLGSETALGRVGEPDDVGGVIAAVLSDRYGYVTNQRIEASGGTLI